jgi:uncharacterized protein (TIGR02453 family)
MQKTPRFPAEGLKFLRALKRNNRREWFQAHREDYERYVRGPMTEFVLALATDFRRIAPEMLADPKISLYRIYRDTRFSHDKTPYKTHAAAVFPRRGLGKHSGAGLYFHVGLQEVWIGGGVYAPMPDQLLAVRQHIAAHPRAFRSIVESPAFRKAFGELEGSKLSRVPVGFRKDHPAVEYLKFKQFLAGGDFPPDLSTSPRFYDTILGVFEKTMPLLRFLNQPLMRIGGPNKKSGTIDIWPT